MEPGIKEKAFEIFHEGMRIRGWWFLREDLEEAPALGILHGIPRAKPVAGDQSYREMARRFACHGFLSFTFNFRGTGVSEGDLSLAGWCRDLAGVLRYCRAWGVGAMALLGFSAGAAVAFRVAAEEPGVGAVVSVGSPADFSVLQDRLPSAAWVRLFREIGLIRSPGFPPSLAEWEAEFEMISPRKWVRFISPRPLLILHGEEDELIPPDHARLLFQAAGEPKDLIFVPRGKHRLRTDPSALSLIEQWVLKWKTSLNSSAQSKLYRGS